jgi:hypothetical protein
MKIIDSREAECLAQWYSSSKNGNSNPDWLDQIKQDITAKKLVLCL